MPDALTLNLCAAIILSIFAYKYSERKIDLIFLIPLLSYILILVAHTSDIPLSYLETPQDAEYYNIIIWMDIIAYLSLYLALKFTEIKNIISSSSELFNYRLIYTLGVICVVLNICIVIPYFGQPYEIITSKHTPLSELGWILISLYIVVTSKNPGMKWILFITMLLVALSLPFGARMQPSFGIMAILVYLTRHVEKLQMLAIFTILTFSSIIIGIVRDLVIEPAGLISLLEGFNQGAIFRTSAVILQYVEEISPEERLLTTLSTFILYPVSGTLVAPETIYLNLQLDKFKAIQGNGSNFGVLMYYYFSYFYPVIIFLSALIFSHIKILRIIPIVLIVTSFRWQQYNFIPLLKILPIILLLALIIHMLPKKAKRHD